MQHNDVTQNSTSDFKRDGMIRKFPYPYKAMFSICSDLDETPDKNTYLEISKYLNTEKDTCMGKGVGLEIGNTIYFDMPSDQFSFYNTDEDGREKIAQLIKSGHIDCLHSYGDFTNSRSRIEEIQKELQSRDCSVAVWVDHAVAPSNFGADIMQGYGDVKSSSVYHADITISAGVKYVWMGRVTSIVGQDCDRNIVNIFNRKHLFQSSKTLLKELVKIVLGRIGSVKYRLHKDNYLCRDTTLRDGSNVIEFMRSNPFWGGVNQSETAYGLHQVLTDDYLKKLVASNGYSILYTHLGKIQNKTEPFDTKTRSSLEKLAEFYRSNQILVTTTRRLLDYNRMYKAINVSVVESEGAFELRITGDCDVADLAGLTIYIDEDKNYEVIFNGKKINDVAINETDETGRKSVSINWNRLKYPL